MEASLELLYNNHEHTQILQCTLLKCFLHYSHANCETTISTLYIVFNYHKIKNREVRTAKNHQNEGARIRDTTSEKQRISKKHQAIRGRV